MSPLIRRTIGVSSPNNARRASGAVFQQLSHRLNSSYQPPRPQQSDNTGPSNPKPNSNYRGFYKNFSRPVAIIALGALFTYQVSYYVWLKLEAVEDKETEIKSLEAQLRELTASNESKNAA